MLGCESLLTACRLQLAGTTPGGVTDLHLLLLDSWPAQQVQQPVSFFLCTYRLENNTGACIKRAWLWQIQCRYCSVAQLFFSTSLFFFPLSYPVASTPEHPCCHSWTPDRLKWQWDVRGVYSLLFRLGFCTARCRLRWEVCSKHLSKASFLLAEDGFV